MASLKNIMADNDPTLEAADRALEAKAAKEPPRPYLGMSQIGESCERKSWYRYRFVKQEMFDSQTLKRFEDGHRTEALIIERLKLLEGITLLDIDQKTGRQFGFVDHDGHFRGHADGMIVGILQAPKANHIFEVKCCSDKKIAELRKAVADAGEKAALKKWNPTYYAQAVLYIDYMGYSRHYLVAATPGGREWMGVRTNADPAHAMKLRARAKRTILSHEPLDKISNKPDWFECRFCAFSGICHNGESPERNCRTCIHSTPVENGEWTCARWGKKITTEEQLAGCVVHKFLPKLVPGEIVNATELGITYRMPDGSTWYDGEVA